MEEETPAQRAEMYAEGARCNYERHGSLAPMVALCTDTKVIMAVAAGGTDDQPSQFGGIIAVLAGRYRPHTIVTVAEGWMKTYPAESETEGRERFDKIRRGELGRMAAAGDPTIGTALMVNAWRLEPDECYAIIDRVTVEPREAYKGKFVRKAEYERTEIDGMQEGHMGETVVAAWRAALENLPPDELDDMDLFALLGSMGLASSVSLQEWGDEPAASD